TKGIVESMELVEVGHNYWPKLTYSYRVNEKNYLGNTIFLDSLLNSPHSGYSKRVAYDLANAYKQNNPVNVYYEPEVPELAVLNTNIPKRLYFIAWALGLMILFHLGLMIYKALA